jgi:hypothetical protein
MDDECVCWDYESPHVTEHKGLCPYARPARYYRHPWPGDRPTVVDVAAARGDRDDRGGGDDITLDGEA